MVHVDGEGGRRGGHDAEPDHALDGAVGHVVGAERGARVARAGGGDVDGAQQRVGREGEVLAVVGGDAKGVRERACRGGALGIGRRIGSARIIH